MIPVPWRAALRVVCAVGFVATAGCNVPDVTLVQPDLAPGEGTGFAIHVTLEDTALAAALGWSVGVPGATVVIHRFIDPYQPDTLYTDPTGRASLANRLPGWYLVAGYRRLADEETGPTGGVIRAFGDGVKHDLAGRDTVELRLQTDRSPGIGFSERYTGGGTRDIQYGYDSFFELYNNGDTTVYVDRMVIGRAYSWVGSLSPCDEQAPYRNDSLGIWSLTFHQFPGGGRDYPVTPGQAVTIALDAADHSQVDPSLPDLSHADFELEGTADIDNPDVPNLPSPYPSTTGNHGMVVISVAAYFLTLPVDPTVLETQLIGGFRYVRFPTDVILDVFSTDEVNPSSEPPFVRNEYCTWINRRFDRLEAMYYRLGGDNRTSIHRRVLRQSGGSPLLHDVNVSFLEWVLGPYSHGRIEF